MEIVFSSAKFECIFSNGLRNCPATGCKIYKYITVRKFWWNARSFRCYTWASTNAQLVCLKFRIIAWSVRENFLICLFGQILWSVLANTFINSGKFPDLNRKFLTLVSYNFY